MSGYDATFDPKTGDFTPDLNDAPYKTLLRDGKNSKDVWQQAHEWATIEGTPNNWERYLPDGDIAAKAKSWAALAGNADAWKDYMPGGRVHVAAKRLGGHTSWVNYMPGHHLHHLLQSELTKTVPAVDEHSTSSSPPEVTLQPPTPAVAQPTQPLTIDFLQSLWTNVKTGVDKTFSDLTAAPAPRGGAGSGSGGGRQDEAPCPAPAPTPVHFSEPRKWGESRPCEFYDDVWGPGNPGWERAHPSANPALEPTRLAVPAYATDDTALDIDGVTVTLESHVEEAAVSSAVPFALRDGPAVAATTNTNTDPLKRHPGSMSRFLALKKASRKKNADFHGAIKG